MCLQIKREVYPMIKRFIAISTLCFALPASALAVEVQVQEVENNGSIPAAQALGLVGPVRAQISGAIDTNPADGKDDIDIFNLGRLVLGSSVTLQTNVFASPLGNLDTIAALYNSKGVILVSSDDQGANANSNRNSYFKYDVTVDDTYYVAIAAWQTGYYTNVFLPDRFTLTPGTVGGDSKGLYVATVDYTGVIPSTVQNGGTVPEPSGLVLSALGLMGLLRMRRQRARV